jgi:hypothetical protein
MIDNQIIVVLTNQIDAAIANAGWDYLISQKDQPEQEGTPTQGTVFFERVGDHRYGHPIFKEVYQPLTDDFAEFSNQLMETTFQISALIPQSPEDLTLPTAADVADYVCQYLQSRSTIRHFKQFNVSMLRVTEVRTPFIILDRDRYEGHPNFDIVLQHSRLLTFTVPAASSIVGAPSGVPGIPGEGVFAVPDGPGESRQ